MEQGLGKPARASSRMAPLQAQVRFAAQRGGTTRQPQDAASRRSAMALAQLVLVCLVRQPSSTHPESEPARGAELQPSPRAARLELQQPTVLEPELPEPKLLARPEPLALQPPRFAP